MHFLYSGSCYSNGRYPSRFLGLFPAVMGYKIGEKTGYVEFVRCSICSNHLLGSHPCYQFGKDWKITNSAKHWNTEQTMLQYIDSNVQMPVHIKGACAYGRLNCTAILIIIEYFKGEITLVCTSRY